RADGPAQWALGHGGDAEAHFLDGGGIDGDDRRFGRGIVVFVNRHHVHAHAVLAGTGVGLARIHGGFVVLDFADGSGFFENGRQLHAADGAVTRFVLDDIGMHAAGVELLFTTRGAIAGAEGKIGATSEA